MSSEPEIDDLLVTVPTLIEDFTNLGLHPGMVLVVHSSLKSIGWVNGGAVAVILALEAVLGANGTLVMPTHTADLSEPANWQHPPVSPAWWDTIRATMPAYDPAMTPSYYVGVIPETFRKQNGVLRSNNPDASFAAWGKYARLVTDNHALFPLFGEQSPLARVYDLDGWVLLLGVDHNRNTSLHVAEGRARIPHDVIHLGSPMLINGERQWVSFDDIDWDDAGFLELGADFARDTGLQREGKVGRARALLMPQRALIDYGVTWLERHRGSSD
ncbi:MAG: AAC(3) family N-acetyltransferase [Anaerolineae bacterium]|nr:AAC(3) family N-acetyltransferase [Anaerolineae bacterium]